MDFAQRLILDIKKIEEDLGIVQDERAYDDKSECYLFNRLAQLRIISKQREIIKRGEEIMHLDTKHDSKEMKMQVEAVKEQIVKEEESNKELEFVYEYFANIYLGQDASVRGEMNKVLNEYEGEGIIVSRDIVDKTDEYMFENYALTEERIKKSSGDTSGGRGIGLGLEMEEDYEQ